MASQKKFQRNILIVCEGEDTEPNYFQQIRNRIIADNPELIITINPAPTEEQEANPVHSVRRGGKVRQLRNPLTTIISDDDLRDYKEYPTRFVRAAQLNLMDGSYDEVWAVFDKDQHPGHARAFQMAEELFDDKKVNIAFSNIAFEHWILLHFELNNTAFSKSMCRMGEDYFLCGENLHQLDCAGNNCVCGRIVHQGYLKYVGKRKKFEFSKFNDRVETAIQNSVRLANSYYGNGLPTYDLNPYTSIYRLVFKLLQLPLDYSWKEFSEPMRFKHFIAKYQVNSNTITINLERISDGTELINSEDFVLIDAAGVKVNSGTRTVIQSGTNSGSISITVIRNSTFHPIFIARRINEIEYHISEIPF